MTKIEQILKILYLHSDIENSGARCYLTKEQFEKAAQEIDKLYSIPVVSNSVCDCKVKEPCAFTEHGKIVEKCVNCGKPIANDC